MFRNTRVVAVMNLPFTVTLLTTTPRPRLLTRVTKQVATYLREVDAALSPYREDSELAGYWREAFSVTAGSAMFQTVFALAQQAARVTAGAFNPYFAGHFDPTGLVKGWAVAEAHRQFLAPLLASSHIIAVGLNGGGDMQLAVRPESAFHWVVGIEDPRTPEHIVAYYRLQNAAVATSGLNKRGQHVRAAPGRQVTVIADDLALADSWVTAGLAATRHQWHQLVVRHHLTGLVIQEGQAQAFAQGRWQHVEALSSR